MPRIRTLKPEAWADRKVGSLTLEARLLWVVLITMSDDYGAFEANPAAIFGFGYRYQHQHLTAIDGWLGELVDAGLVVLYEAGEEQYGLFPKWSDHQNVQRPSKTRLPFPGDSGVIRGRVSRESHDTLQSPSGESHEGLRTVSGKSHESSESPENPGPLETLKTVSGQSPETLRIGTRTTDHGPRTLDRGSSGGDAGASELPHVVACLKAAGFDAGEIELDWPAVRNAIAKRQPPEDVDWDLLGQRIERLRREGKIESNRPSSSLAFVFSGFQGLPRVGQGRPGASLFQSTTGDAGYAARMADKFGEIDRQSAARAAGA